MALSTNGMASDPYELNWNSLGEDASDSMPLGNGEVGINLWTEPNGDILFYISRTDAFSEACRLLKLGRVRVRLTPNPFVSANPFSHRLILREGRIELSGDGTTVSVFVDPSNPTIHVEGRSENRTAVHVTLESWRSQPKRLNGEELASSWTMLNAPATIEVWESADKFADVSKNAVVWFHRNEHSIVPFTLRHQGIDGLAPLVKDPLLNRAFGGWMSGSGFVRSDLNSLASASPMNSFSISITTDSSIAQSEEAWLERLREVASKRGSTALAKRANSAWWKRFWHRSWIEVSGDADAEKVTRAYVLQRFVTACGGRGSYPIKFNGSIFTVEPKHAGGPDFNPDWRRWGDCFWWQNTRFPYAAMPARGDFDQMPPLFDFFMNMLPVCKARTKQYYAAEGVYFPETVNIFGAYGNNDYGWNREGRVSSEVLCPWWAYSWQQGLELVSIMLDAYDVTLDEDILVRYVLPLSREVFAYYDSRFKRDENGILILSPTQAVETYWFDVVNDTPTVAGLTYVLDRLLTLPLSKVSKSDYESWIRLRAATPPIPIKNGRIAPAERFKDQRNNVENPELYAVWPFEVFGLGKPNLQIAIDSFDNRIERSSSGWQYDGQCAALLGLGEVAKNLLIGKAGNSHKNFRFPAMWGPNYDWLPDQCHGSNLMLTLQTMLIQSKGSDIYLAPAWPKGWDARFKLHATGKTVIEGEIKGGSIRLLFVSPEASRSKIRLGLPQHSAN